MANKAKVAAAVKAEKRQDAMVKVQETKQNVAARANIARLRKGK